MRWALDLTWQQSREPGLSAGYNLKLYTGNVDYTGAFVGTNIPVSGETHYRGMVNEIQALYRMPQNMVDIVLAAGWDRFDRELNSSQEESWDVVYARLGANFNALTRQGVFGSVGVKYPVWTRENAHLTAAGFDQNPRLRPGKDFSFYATLGLPREPGVGRARVLRQLPLQGIQPRRSDARRFAVRRISSRRARWMFSA